MTQILFVQGGGENVHDGWDHALVASLERELRCSVRYPRMPSEDDPSYARWKPALVKELEALDDGAILVGHSIGGTLLVHALAEEARFKPAAVMLIAAPFVGEGGWPSDELPRRTDLGLSVPVFLYQGTADDTVPPQHVELYARAIPHAVVRLLADRDHQLNNDLAAVARDVRDLLRA